MATYASTSNPFIKTSNNCTSPVKRATKKDAPGMAKPQNLIINQQKEANLMMMMTTNISDDPNSIKLSEPTYESLLENNYLNNNSKLIDVCCEEKEGVNSQNKNKENKSCFSDGEDEEDDSFEITKACESLVEMTVKLELEERNKANQSINKDDNSTDTSKTPTSSLTSNVNEECVKDKFTEDDDIEIDLEPAPMERSERQHQHIELIKKLRLQLRDLEKYAYDRGELDQVPPSVIAERQSVILDTLKERLSLNISRGEIERLELDELRKQVDKEIHDLIDPLITKEYLLNQLKTQLTDLERYISHLHGTIGKIHNKRSCSCKVHGCSTSNIGDYDENNNNEKLLSKNTKDSTTSKSSNLNNNEALPKTSKLIRSLVTQLVCSDIKLRETAKKEKDFEQGIYNKNIIKKIEDNDGGATKKVIDYEPSSKDQQQFNDEAAWSLHIDRVILAADSLVNLFTLEQPSQQQHRFTNDKSYDDGLVESIVRRQLVPAIRDLLSYGIIDHNSIPTSNSYVSILFDPYYLLSTLTCFPTSQKQPSSNNNNNTDKIHVWDVIVDYYNSKNEPNFKSSSAKTLSQSFNLAPSISGPIKITSKQALLIAVEDIIETLSKCKPNGPESHFRSFIYTALNRNKLTTWLRLIFKNKSVNRKYYYNFSFTSQADKMDRFLSILEALNKFEFKLRTDVESIEQFVSAF